MEDNEAITRLSNAASSSGHLNCLSTSRLASYQHRDLSHKHLRSICDKRRHLNQSPIFTEAFQKKSFINSWSAYELNVNSQPKEKDGHVKNRTLE